MEFIIVESINYVFPLRWLPLMARTLSFDKALNEGLLMVFWILLKGKLYG